MPSFENRQKESEVKIAGEEGKGEVPSLDTGAGMEDKMDYDAIRRENASPSDGGDTGSEQPDAPSLNTGAGMEDKMDYDAIRRENQPKEN